MVDENVAACGAIASVKEGKGTPGLPDYEIHSTRRLVTVKFGKKVTARDIEGYLASLRANPRFNPDFSEIVDLSEVEELDVQGDELARLADGADAFSAQAKRAFVARNAVQNHAARMYKILRAQVNAAIFRSVGAAERWIGP
ncbi:MAG: hypothetical protein WB562_19600 [Candidatus Sulfotelmatobacter sp.]